MTSLVAKLRGAVDPDANEPLDRLLEDAANEIERLTMKADIQDKAIEQGMADFKAIGDRYLEGREEIESLHAELAARATNLRETVERLRAALKGIYHASNEAEIRNMAWDAAQEAL